jgi:hypothetical protein
MVVVVMVVVLVVVGRIGIIEERRARDEGHVLAGVRLADGRDIVDLAANGVERR